MAILKSWPLLILVPCALGALAVEYELDGPLDLKQRWQFLRRPDFFVQHQCPPPKLARIDEQVQEFLIAPKLWRLTPVPQKPLQLRVYASAEKYRNEMHFSQDRQGHFNIQRNLVVTHCNAPRTILDEQLMLYALSTSRLRQWQRIFIAETLPRLEEKARPAFFSDAAKEPSAKLRYLLLSNHVPGKGERATMRALAHLLWEEGELRRFVKLLVAGSKSDDTGIEALEKIFSKNIKTIEKQMQKEPD